MIMHVEMQSTRIFERFSCMYSGYRCGVTAVAKINIEEFELWVAFGTDTGA